MSKTTDPVFIDLWNKCVDGMSMSGLDRDEVMDVLYLLCKKLNVTPEELGHEHTDSII